MPQFRCPTCREPLHDAGPSVCCANGHVVDRSREGYVNLLPGGRLKGRSPGDDETMVASRRRVLDSGLYAVVLDALAAAVAADSPEHVLDVGCGEGSYLAAITQRTGATGWGIDISKPAVRAAARRHRGHHYAVASSYALPFTDGEMDAVVNVFSPRDAPEMMRVIRPGGTAYVVTPGPGHLAELKRAIYEAPREHDADGSMADLAPTTTTVITATVAIAGPSLAADLIGMTPFRFSAPPERLVDVAASLTQITIDMLLSSYRRPS